MNKKVKNINYVNIELESATGALGRGEVFTNSVITLHRRVQLCLATSGAISTLAPITHVAFGTGGVDTAGNPIMPNEGQNDVNNRVGIYPVSVSYPLDPAPRTTAQYIATIPAPDLVSAQINEAALIDSEGNAHAIVAFYSKGKDPGVSMRFSFNDIF